jgi:hypothetical protein
MERHRRTSLSKSGLSVGQESVYFTSSPHDCSIIEAIEIVRSLFSPIDFKLSADQGNVSGQSDYGVEMDAKRAVSKSAVSSHCDGLYNFARCLEYGKGIPRHFIRISFGLRNTTAWLQSKAAHRRKTVSESALSARLESKRTVLSLPMMINGQQGTAIQMTRTILDSVSRTGGAWCKALDWRSNITNLLRIREAAVNYRPCLRRSGQREGSDRRSNVSCHPPSRDDLTRQFIACFDNPPLIRLN